MRRIALLIVTVLAGLVASSAAAASDPPTYAYYYIWFSASSWNRAKTDYSKLGRYSSDEQRIMRQHIRWAKQTGIDGWIVSWKDTPVLTDRLEMLATIAAQERFKLSVIYQGLDFERRPLQPSRVGRDIDTFLHRFGRNPVFAFRGRPLIIWSGTWKFTADEIASVTENRRRHVAILATERNAVSYEAKADAVDGDAYYWSSLNPYTYPDAAGKLRSLSTAVDRTEGCGSRRPRPASTHARSVGPRSCRARGARRCAKSSSWRSAPSPTCSASSPGTSSARTRRSSRVCGTGSRRSRYSPTCSRHRDHVPPLTSTPVRRPAGMVH